MSGRGRTIAGLLAVAAGLGLSAAALHAGDALARPGASAGRVLYVRSGAVARRMLLSFDALGADIYWIRTIQHYGRDRKSTRVANRFELLAPLLDLTASLDPRFNVAYRVGAVLLAEPPPSGPGRIDQAVALLEKGLRSNPNRWQYAFDIGFIDYWYGSGNDHFAAAARWFERAAGMPDAPIWLKQLAATTHAAGGDRQGARALLQELANSEEEWIQRAARRGLQQLAALDDVERLQTQLDLYVTEHHRAPSSWAELDPGAPPGAVPVDPTGVPFEYDAAARRVVLSSKSSLFPLPQMPAVQ